jgi:hypothetical protein
MLKRLFGLLIILSLIAPPFLALETVTIAQGIADDLDAAAQQRFTAIDAEANVIATEVTELRQALSNITTSMSVIKLGIMQTLAAIAKLPNQITIPDIILPRVDLPPLLIPIPDIPAFDLITLDLGALGKYPITFPGFVIPDVSLKIPAFDLPRIPGFTIEVPILNDIKIFLQTAFQNLDQIIDALIGVTGVQKIADSAGKIATELQGFGGDLQTISSTWSDPIRRLGTIFAVWLILVWIVAVVAYFKKALDLLLDR